MGIKIDQRNEMLNDKDMSLQLEMMLANPFAGPIESGWEYIFDENEVGAANSTPERIYLTTNENISEFFKGINFDGRNKRVLTVGSSFDQAMNAILFGSKDITVIDLNIYTKIFSELKLAALKNLSFEEFNDFFANNDKKTKKGFPFFEKFNLYQKISHDLSKDSQIFWDTVMLEGTDENIKNLFHERVIMGGNIIHTSKQAYQKVQEVLKNEKVNIEFINANYFDFDKKTKGKFDLILLSNIIDYYNSDFELNEHRFSREFENEFFFTLEDLYNNKLNDDGIMQFSTSYMIGNGNSERILKRTKSMLQDADLLRLKKAGLYNIFINEWADCYAVKKPEQKQKEY